MKKAARLNWSPLIRLLPRKASWKEPPPCSEIPPFTAVLPWLFFSPFSGYALQGSYKTQSFSVSLASSEFFQGKDLKELARTSWSVLKVNEVSLLAMSREKSLPVALFPQSGAGQGLSQQLYGKIFFFFLFKELF